MSLKKLEKSKFSQKQFDEFVAKYNEVLSKINKFCFYTRAIEFQKSSIEILDELSDECEEHKQLAIKADNEDWANALLSLKVLCNAIKCELRMWINLKEDKLDSAWNDLISAQYSISAAVRIHPISNSSIYQMKKLLFIENTIFPPQQFLSSGGILRESKCSICKEDYEKCEHIKGKAYMGEMCVQELLKIDLQEVSLVDEPADKRCRVYSFSDEGKMRDVMTWKLFEKKNNENG